MLVASFSGAGTLLFVGEDPLLDRPGGQAFAEYSHKQFVDARHECDWADVRGVGGVVLLEYQDCAGVLPALWDVLLTETAVEDEGEDGALWVDSLKVGIFDSIRAR